MQHSNVLTYASPDDPKMKQLVIRSIERLTGQRKLEKAYLQLISEVDDDQRLWGEALNRLNTNLIYDPQQFAKIPQDGPVIFVANHPYGVLDGLAICHLAAASRGDFRVLVNASLCLEQRIEKYLLPIDFTETKEAARANVKVKREAMNTLKNNGTIVIFPAGAISTSEGLFGEVKDEEWKLFTAKMIQMTKATVVPIYFHGQNSRLFQMVSQFSPTVRLSLIMHEVRRMEGKNVYAAIGDPIPYTQIEHIKSRRELLKHFYDLIYDMGEQYEDVKYKKFPRVRKAIRPLGH